MNVVPVKSDVIQGCVLNPLPSLFIKMLFATFFGMGKPFLYADDFKVMYSFSPYYLNNEKTCISKENKLAQGYSKWML